MRESSSDSLQMNVPMAGTTMLTNIPQAKVMPSIEYSTPNYITINNKSYMT